MTISAYQKGYLFGEIKDGVMVENEVGRMIRIWWEKLPSKFSHIEVDPAFVVMPNHIHGIIWILDSVRRDMSCFPVWHRNYYGRIIRSDRELQDIRTYILENPLHWERDPER